MKRLLLALLLMATLVFAAAATPAMAKGRECAGHTPNHPPPCKVHH